MQLTNIFSELRMEEANNMKEPVLQFYIHTNNQYFDMLDMLTHTNNARPFTIGVVSRSIANEKSWFYGELDIGSIPLNYAGSDGNLLSALLYSDGHEFQHQYNKRVIGNSVLFSLAMKNSHWENIVFELRNFFNREYRVLYEYLRKKHKSTKGIRIEIYCDSDNCICADAPFVEDKCDCHYGKLFDPTVHDIRIPDDINVKTILLDTFFIHKLAGIELIPENPYELVTLREYMCIRSSPELPMFSYNRGMNLTHNSLMKALLLPIVFKRIADRIKTFE